MTSPSTPDLTPAPASDVLGQQPATDIGSGATETSVPAPVGEAPSLDEAPEPEGAESVDSVGQFTDSEGRVHHASPFSKNTQVKVASGEWKVGVVDVPPPFDPTGKTVKDVVKHLRAHADDQAEVARVQLAEAEGEDRVTIRQWTPSS